MTVPLLRDQVTAAPAQGEWLLPISGHWVDAACTSLAQHTSVVRIVVVSLRGSAPREAGACMLVGPRGSVGTIGGGNLEWQAIRAARELLRSRATTVRLDDLVLGPELGQCCGGRVALWLERLTRNDLVWLREAGRALRDRSHSALVTYSGDGLVSHQLLTPSEGATGIQLQRGAGRLTLVEFLRVQRPSLWIYGAGHVGQALVRLLSELALFEVTWIDERPELLPAGLAEGVTARAEAAPVESVAQAPSGTRFVVLTHDHALDYALCRAILLRADAAWLGLIGSVSKSARFRSRLLRDGLTVAQLAGLSCPIGIDGIVSKLPGAIAIAIGAQLLRQLGAGASAGIARGTGIGIGDPRRSDAAATCSSCAAGCREPT